MNERHSWREVVRLLAIACTGALLAPGWLGCSEQSTPPRSGSRSGSGDVDPRASAPPNLVLITLDTVRADALGAYGQQLETSPNVDRMAREGVLFEWVATSNPETLPAHATIFTGRWPYVHGVRANAGYVLSDRNLTLAEVLKSHGYRTAAEVATPVLRSETQVAQGFDHYRGVESPGVTLKVVRYTRGAAREETLRMRVGSDVTSRAIEFVRGPRDEPFFLWLHYFDAHNPYSAPAAFNKRIPESPYHAEVASLDFQLGLLIGELERLGLRDTTLVVLTADHGEGLGEHGEPSHSFLLYDTTMRVPLILWGPGSLPVGKRISSPVRTVDILPTVLDLLGLEAVTDIQGVSLRPLLSGATSDLGLQSYGEATRFAATFGLPVLRSLRDGRWKYIHKVNPELYDVIADPSERTNLAERHPDTLARLRGQLEQRLKSAPPAPSDAGAAVDAETAAQLTALGYVAKSPEFAIADAVASLELSGADPMTKVGDIARIAEANGLLRRKEFEEALQTLIPLRDSNPNSSYVLGLVSTALRGQGRDDEAVVVLRRIRLLEPSNAEVAFELASLLGGPSGSSHSPESSEAVEILSGLLRRTPCDERFQLEQSRRLRQLARYAELVELLAEGALHCPDMLANLNNQAWALATLPDARLRDGARAVQIMRGVLRQADANASQPDPAYLDTLAAALAEAGEFEEAIRSGSAVLQRVEAEDGPAPALDELRRHLDAYRSRSAIRDPEPSGSDSAPRSVTQDGLRDDAEGPAQRDRS